nr:response regulator [Methylocella silvestris]
MSPYKYFQSGTVVLIVEDEPLILMNAVCIIEDAGFTALVAGNADEAILILEQRTDIRVVFTDIEMPGSMDGVKLARAIRGRWPPIDLILTSGRRLVSPEDIPVRGRFLAKPYRPADVVEALQQMAA